MVWGSGGYAHSLLRKVSQVPETTLPDPEVHKTPNKPAGEVRTHSSHLVVPHNYLNGLTPKTLF